MIANLGLVIITRNRADTVVRSLGHAVECGEAGRIVVVDNGSDDGTPRRIRKQFPQVAVIALGRNLGAAARNIGVGALRTPYIAFADDDTWWAPGSLPEAVGLLERHPRLGVVCARVVVGADDRPDPACDLMEHSPLAPHPDLPGPRLVAFMAGASAMRRDAFLAAGGFEPRFVIGAEERLLGWDLRRAGWNIVYVDHVVVHHHPSPARDATRRAIQQRRNELLCAWLRLPWRAAAAATRDALRRGRTDAASRRACVAALANLPWALRNRRSVPADLAREIALVERAVENHCAHAAAIP